jgi:putative endonuclease
MNLVAWFRSYPIARARRRFAILRAASLVKPFHREIRGGALTTAEIGDLGELLAARFLRENGRKVLARNFASVEGGEVDIVCRHGRVLTFVEVKTRTRLGVHRPVDAVNAEKQLLIIRGARFWLQMLENPRVPFRFDVVEVILLEGEVPQMNIVENAFQLQKERR